MAEMVIQDKLLRPCDVARYALSRTEPTELTSKRLNSWQLDPCLREIAWGRAGEKKMRVVVWKPHSFEKVHFRSS